MVCQIYQPPYEIYTAAGFLVVFAIIWIGGSKIEKQLKQYHPETFDRVRYDLGQANSIFDVLNVIPKSLSFITFILFGQYFKLGDAYLNRWAIAWQVTSVIVLAVSVFSYGC